jgi:hypothetical protein
MRPQHNVFKMVNQTRDPCEAMLICEDLQSEGGPHPDNVAFGCVDLVAL